MSKKASSWCDVLATGLAYASTALAPLAVVSAEPLSVDAALDLKTFVDRSPIDLSDDGQWVAYTLRAQREFAPPSLRDGVFYTPTGVSFDAVGTSLWVTDVARAQSKRLVPAPASSWGGVWSPDGARLAFFSDRDGATRLWIWDRTRNRLQPAAAPPARPFFLFETPSWSDDGRSVLFKSVPRNLQPRTDAGKTSAAQPRVRVFRSSDRRDTPAPGYSAILDRYRSDLTLLDTTTGRSRTIAEDLRIMGYSLAPGGHSAAFTTIVGRESAQSQDLLYDVYVVAPLTAAPRKIASRISRSYGIRHGWSPDGKYFVYTTNSRHVAGSIFHSGEVPQAHRGLFIYEVRSGESRQLLTDAHPDFGSSYGFPVWSRAGERFYYVGAGELWEFTASDGSSRRIAESPLFASASIVSGGAARTATDAGGVLRLIGSDRETQEALFLEVSLADGSVRELRREAGAHGSALFLADAAASIGRAVYVFQNADQPPVLKLLQPDGGERIVANPNPELVSQRFGASRMIEWTSTDGERLRGALLLPSDYQPHRRYPLLVEVYGGEMGSRSVHLFGLGDAGVLNKQLWATRGYVVLKPDMPLRVGTPLTDIAAAVLPGIDKLIELGIADENRLAVMGHSYGGYSVLALLVQTQRFRAAIASAGTADLISAYGRMSPDGSTAGTGWAEEGQGRMGGTLWEYPQRYIDNSPIFRLDRVATPLLLVHGEQDHGVPVTSSDQVFVGLSRLGRKVELVRYTHGGHTEASFDAVDGRDYLSRAEQWLRENLALVP